MKKILSVLIGFILLFQCVPCVFAAAEGVPEGETIRVIAASDFQPQNGVESGKTAMRNILSAMEQDNITTADGFLFCGDYDYSTVGNATATRAGVQAVKDVMIDIVPKENIVLAQGNHDTASGISKSGKNDPASGEYGVFVIHEDDYMWFNNDENRIKRTTQNLIDYLNGKLAISYDNPIFIVSHLPLHYTMRTEKDGDGQHANYIFDVLNEAGAKGLNLFFLFGHNHSNGWDDHLGGSAIYLARGDEIEIAQNSREAEDCKREILNFTYLNAGYVGYYGDNADTLLTMTVFEIEGGEVRICRYSQDGIQLLKRRGVNEYKKVYHSPQVVSLNDVPESFYFLKDCIEGNNQETMISIIGGIATVDDISVDDALEGDIVRITAEKAPEGMIFEKWIVEEGNVELANPSNGSTTFTMPDEKVKIVAVYQSMDGTVEQSGGCFGAINISLYGGFAIAVLSILIFKKRAYKE